MAKRMTSPYVQNAEWPTGAKKGWDSRCISRLIKKMRELNRTLFWRRFHGCAYGLCYRGYPILKSWTVMTSNREIWLSFHPEQIERRGIAAQASSIGVMGSSSSLLPGAFSAPSACPSLDHHLHLLVLHQYASWVTRVKCGLKLQYCAKKAGHGQTRQMGPDPHLIRLAAQTLEKTFEPNATPCAHANTRRSARSGFLGARPLKGHLQLDEQILFADQQLVNCLLR